jgi:glutamate-1-semialdehyde 2,1-aminomutase
MSSYAAPSKSPVRTAFVPRLGEEEKRVAHEICEGFVPPRLFDLHAHLLRGDQFPDGKRPSYWDGDALLGAEAYRKAMGDFFGSREWSGLFFGFPAKGNDSPAINEWMVKEVDTLNDGSQALYLSPPAADAADVTEQLQSGRFAGLKPYHLYAKSEETEQAPIESFAPEWMWEACHVSKSVLMLHIMRDGGISDPGNQETLRRLLNRYPQCHLVLAHIARSFNYRCARGNLRWLSEFENVWLDASAITETETFRIALQELGAARIAYGSDFPISHLRGKSMTVSGPPRWFYSDQEAYSPSGMPLVGIESLRCLREACEDLGLGEDDLRCIFETNALRVLRRDPERTQTKFGPDLWRHAKSVISGGSGLRSKWAELYDPGTWPSYFSRCKGSHIWDVNGRQYTDFGAGAGAIVLGYSDPVVDQAVRQRIGRGTYCTLLSPQEVELAELLLELHPWAGRVRYARGGGEAMGVAVRIARAATDRSGVAFCGYHGWQDWYLAANLGDGKNLDGHLLPGLAPLGVPRELKGTAVPFKYNDLAAFEAALAELGGRPAAVVMEPMRTQFPEPGFLETIKRRTAEVGAVLIMDEITSGWRFGFPGASALFGLEPDIAVYAKATSNGFPCGAIIGRAEVMDGANGSFISSSYWTDGVGPAAALASVRRMRDLKVQPAIWQRGEDFQNRLRQLAAQHPDCKAVIGGMPANPYIAFDLGELANKAKIAFIRMMVARGYLCAGGNFIMFTHTDQMFDGFLAAAEEAYSALDQLVSKGELEDYVGAAEGIGNFARLT